MFSESNLFLNLFLSPHSTSLPVSANNSSCRTAKSAYFVRGRPIQSTSRAGKVTPTQVIPWNPTPQQNSLHFLCRGWADIQLERAVFLSRNTDILAPDNMKACLLPMATAAADLNSFSFCAFGLFSALKCKLTAFLFNDYSVLFLHKNERIKFCDALSLTMH